MSWRTIGTVYAKELRESLRDRRTLISMIVIPTFVMPAIIVGAGKLASNVATRARAEIPRIMVIGGTDSPGIRAEIEKTGKFRVETASPDWKVLISDKKIRAAVEIPPGFEKALDSGSAPTVTLYNYQGELKSSLAEEELSGFFSRLRSQATARLLGARGIPASYARPFEVAHINVAPPEKVGGNLLGGIVPYFIVILCLMGAMYPAMEVTAGEKERGTMETLLCSPVRRTHIVVGKFLMVLTGSLTAVVLSLISLGGSAWLIGIGLEPALGGRSPGASAGLTIAPLGIVGVLAMVLPVAVLFSALVFSISLFAKSIKEAGSYLTPLAFIVILPCSVGLIPGIELNYHLALFPIVNVSLVCKEMLSGVWHWGYIAVIFGSTAIYASAALAAAVWMFRREDVIFRT
jgi:sodium transport system permease protein